MDKSVLKFFKWNPDGSWVCEYPLVISTGGRTFTLEAGDLVMQGNQLGSYLVSVAGSRRCHSPPSLTERRHLVAEKASGLGI